MRKAVPLFFQLKCFFKAVNANVCIEFDDNQIDNVDDFNIYAYNKITFSYL